MAVGASCNDTHNLLAHCTSRLVPLIRTAITTILIRFDPPVSFSKYNDSQF
jgi:hypothetical protein